QLSAYVDAWLASYLGNGAVSSFSYAQALYVLPISLFGMAISAAELPTMSRATGTTAEIGAYLRGRLSDGLDRIAYFIVPSAIAFLALGDLIVLVLFQSGKFQRGNTIWVWQILIGSTVGILVTTMGRLYSSTFYALRDTRTPLRYAVIRVILTTGLGYFFALVLPGLLGVDRKLGAAGGARAAGMAWCGGAHRVGGSSWLGRVLFAAARNGQEDRPHSTGAGTDATSLGRRARRS